MLKRIISLLFLQSLLLGCGADKTTQLTLSGSDSTSSAERLCQELLISAYGPMEPSSLLSELSGLSPHELNTQLNTDAERYAFWVNVYNAFIQLELRSDTTLYDNRDQFFSRRNKNIAGFQLSFNDIEHGILRRNKGTYTLGYINRIGTRDPVKLFMVDNLDWRIHFALNCGARSCPPVRLYESKGLSEQFDEATTSYLGREVVTGEAQPLSIPKLFLWFRGDFGGNKGITKILQKFGGIAEVESKKWSYKRYDWTLELSQQIEGDSEIKH